MAVTAMLLLSHDNTPPLYLLPKDALTVISRTDANATVRVNEKYFTGAAKVNDYSLVSDNGMWTLADIQAAPIPNPGDLMGFLHDEFTTISHIGFWTTHHNFDSDFQFNPPR